MNEDNVQTVALIGFPETGKTTFTVAFFLACIESKEGINITRYGAGQREYLNRLAVELAECRELARTRQTEEDELRLNVQLSPTSDEIKLVIPDLSGERLLEGMESRVFDADLAELVTQADAALLFVRCDKLTEPELLVEYSALVDGLTEEREATTAPEAPDDWTVGLAPTQVRVTDALQEVLRLRRDQKLRLAIVVSAWDLKAEDVEPRDWLSSHFGLLAQLLEGDSRVTWTTFGVSAQGGDFSNRQERERLAETALSDRPFVCSPDGDRVGIGAPLKWALGVEP